MPRRDLVKNRLLSPTPSVCLSGSGVGAGPLGDADVEGGRQHGDTALIQLQRSRTAVLHSRSGKASLQFTALQQGLVTGPSQIHPGVSRWETWSMAGPLFPSIHSTGQKSQARPAASTP